MLEQCGRGNIFSLSQSHLQWHALFSGQSNEIPQSGADLGGGGGGGGGGRECPHLRDSTPCRRPKGPFLVTDP